MGSTCKGKFLRKLTGPGSLFTFLLTYSLHNRILEVPDVVYVIPTILLMLFGYSLLKFNWKKMQNYMLKNYMLTIIDHFLIFWSKKNNPESEEWSSQWIFQFKQLERRSLKKIRASTGFEPVTSAIPVRCSTNWALKPHIGSEVNLLSSYLPVRSEMMLLKLENSLRWSFFTFIYDRSSNIWIISYILTSKIILFFPYG